MKSQSIDAINPSKLKIREAAEPGDRKRVSRKRVSRKRVSWAQEGISLPGRGSQITLLNFPLRFFGFGFVFFLFLRPGWPGNTRYTKLP